MAGNKQKKTKGGNFSKSKANPSPDVAKRNVLKKGMAGLVEFINVIKENIEAEYIKGENSESVFELPNINGISQNWLQDYDRVQFEEKKNTDAFIVFLKTIFSRVLLNNNGKIHFVGRLKHLDELQDERDHNLEQWRQKWFNESRSMISWRFGKKEMHYCALACICLIKMIVNKSSNTLYVVKKLEKAESIRTKISIYNPHKKFQIVGIFPDGNNMTSKCDKADTNQEQKSKIIQMLAKLTWLRYSADRHRSIIEDAVFDEHNIGDALPWFWGVVGNSSYYKCQHPLPGKKSVYYSFEPLIREIHSIGVVKLFATVDSNELADNPEKNRKIYETEDFFNLEFFGLPDLLIQFMLRYMIEFGNIKSIKFCKNKAFPAIECNKLLFEQKKDANFFCSKECRKKYFGHFSEAAQKSKCRKRQFSSLQSIYNTTIKKMPKSKIKGPWPLNQDDCKDCQQNPKHVKARHCIKIREKNSELFEEYETLKPHMKIQ